VAELTPPRTDVADPWGAHRGSVTVPPGVDLAAPNLDEALDAEQACCTGNRRALLLDTHAILWLDNGDPLSAAAHEAIRQFAPAGRVLVSPVSAWEIGLLVSKGRLAVDLEPVDWFRRFLRVAGIRLTHFTIEVAAGCSFLPEPFHGDSADRMLVATARECDVPLVTRDRGILDYGASGGVRTIPC
jgi:PIN domain nuclease of toxin-antitoxin system